MTPYASATSGIAEIIADARAIRSERHRRCDNPPDAIPQPPPRKRTIPPSTGVERHDGMTPGTHTTAPVDGLVSARTMRINIDALMRTALRKVIG